MSRIFSRIETLGAAFGVIAIVTLASGPAQAAPFVPVPIGVADIATVEQASFWGMPFPHGYQPRYRCTRHVRVVTRHGTRVRRAWVCR